MSDFRVVRKQEAAGVFDMSPAASLSKRTLRTETCAWCKKNFVREARLFKPNRKQYFCTRSCMGKNWAKHYWGN